jgi:hypothetical protein
MAVMRLSARTGEGFDDWYGWLTRELSAAQQHAAERATGLF